MRAGSWVSNAYETYLAPSTEQLLTPSKVVAAAEAARFADMEREQRAHGALPTTAQPPPPVWQSNASGWDAEDGVINVDLLRTA